MKKGLIMQQYALLKSVGRHEYVVVKYTDHCLGVLAHFLTDGASADNFKEWIEKNEKGMQSGKVTFLKKNGDTILLGFDPVSTGKHDQFQTTKLELLSYIALWHDELKRNADEVLLRRDGEKVIFHSTYKK